MLKHLMLFGFSDLRIRFSSPRLNKITGLQVHTPKLNACLGNPRQSIEPNSVLHYTGFVVEIGSGYYALDHVLACYLYSGDLYKVIHRSVSHVFSAPDYISFSDDLNSGLLNNNIRTLVFRALLNNTTVKEQLKQEFNLSCVRQ